MIVELAGSFPVGIAERDEFNSLIVGNAREVSLGEGGCISLPEEFFHQADIDENAIIVGLGKCFQIWNEMNWRRQMYANSIYESALPKAAYRQQIER